MGRYTPIVDRARSALEMAPMVWRGHGKDGRHEYVGFGGEIFSSTAINKLIRGGYAQAVGRGVVSIRMMRRAAVSMIESTAVLTEKHKT